MSSDYTPEELEGRLRKFIDGEPDVVTPDDVTADSDEAVTGRTTLPEPKPYPKNERGHRSKNRGIGFTKKDKSKNKKSRRKMAKKSKKKNRRK